MPDTLPMLHFGWSQSMARRIAAELANPKGVLGWFVGRAMDRINHAMTQRSIQLLEAGPGEQVLEVGFGGGRSLRQLLDMVSAGMVYGLEQSRTSVRAAGLRHARALREGRLVLAHGDAAAMPWPGSQFDRALAINTIYFWSDTAAELAELHRVLRPDGRLVLAYRPLAAMQRLPMSAHGFRLRTDDEVLQVLALAGFEVLAVEFDDTIGREHVCVVARRWHPQLGLRRANLPRRNPDHVAHIAVADGQRHRR